MTERLTDPEIYRIHSTFADTKHGAVLNDRVRYDRYNVDGISNSEWVRTLGADVNNLTHMPLTYGIARAFTTHSDRLSPGQFTEREKTLLLVGAIVHDQGESIIGDITYGDKTDDDEDEERNQFARYADEFAVGLPNHVRSFVDEAREQVIFNKETHLSRAFNAIECVGYMRTTLRAARVLENKPTLSPKAAGGLRWLIADVLTNAIPLKLSTHGEEFAATRAYVSSEEHRITAAMQNVRQPDDFKHYGEAAAAKILKFQEVSAVWAGSKPSLVNKSVR